MNLLRAAARDLGHIFNRRFFRNSLLLARTALKRQYRESFIGIGWSLLQPAINILVMSFVFSHIMRAPMKDYALYVLSGLLPWTLMTGPFTSGANTLLARAGIIRGGCMLPKTMLIMADIFVNIYVFCISFFLLYLIIALLGAPVSFTILWWPLTVLPVLITSVCGAVAFAYTAPYIRDVGHLIAVLFGALFWTVPIAYPIALIPEESRHFFEWNPFYLLIRPIQNLVHKGVVPSAGEVAVAFAIAFIAALAAWLVHRKLRRNVVYYL